jgi:hypothetical protein
VIAPGYAVGGVKARALVAESLFIHRAMVFQALIKRRGFDRSTGKAVRMRIGDLVTLKVILARLDHLPLLVGIGAKAARVIVAHGNIGGVMHHPASQFAG